MKIVKKKLTKILMDVPNFNKTYFWERLLHSIIRKAMVRDPIKGTLNQKIEYKSLQNKRNNVQCKSNCNA